MFTYIKKKLLFETWGRHSHYLLSSGLLTRLKAKESKNGQIILPNGHCICDFNLKENIDYSLYDNLHIILFDGIKDYVEKKYFFDKYSSKKIYIHYIGKFDHFWKKIPNSCLLYDNNIEDFKKNLIISKKLFPNVYSQNLRRLFITSVNFTKNYSLFYKYYFSGKKNIYFGNIYPKQEYLIYIKNKYHLNEKDIELLLNQKDKINIDIKIKVLVNLIFKIKDLIKHDQDYNILIEFINTFFRLIIATHLSRYENFFIYDGKFYNKNFFNIYNSLGGNHHVYLDFGSKIGFDPIYPRVDDIIKYKKNYKLTHLEEKILFLNKEETKDYFEIKLHNFLNDLIINKN